MTPIAKFFGDGSRCIDYGGGVSVHWFPSFKPGSKCRCGRTTYQPEERHEPKPKKPRKPRERRKL